jgi:hypothetical protein
MKSGQIDKFDFSDGVSVVATCLSVCGDVHDDNEPYTTYVISYDVRREGKSICETTHEWDVDDGDEVGKAELGREGAVTALHLLLVGLEKSRRAIHEALANEE